MNSVKNYTNMHETQLQALQTCSDLTKDVVPFSIIAKFCDSTEPALD